MKKRDFLKTLPVWIAPVVGVVNLPAHAQTSEIQIDDPVINPVENPVEDPPVEDPPNPYDCPEGYEWEDGGCVPCHPPNESFCK